MKRTNFITTLSPQQQYEIRRWFLVTIALALVVCIGCMCFIVPPLYSVYLLKNEVCSLKKQTALYNTLATTRSKLKKENEQLQKKRTTITAYKEKPANPHEYLAAIIQACTKESIFETARCDKNSIEMHIVCPTTESVPLFTQKLLDTGYFKEVQIVAMNRDEQKNVFRCIVKSKI